VVAGSASRGVAGENILARALAQLPPDLLAINVAFGSKIVEYALRLPGGRLLPIDSKWTSVPALERLATVADGHERRKLQEQVARDVRSRARDMAKYLDPERTLALAVLAVPDAVYAAAPEVLGDAYREGVLVVPYSLALPYVLALYRLTLRFGASVDGDKLAERLRALDDSLRRAGDEVEGRLSRGLVQAQNARDALREHVLAAQATSARLLKAAESADALPVEALVAERLPEPVGEPD
jgi:DNA recombination protein RmuC